MVAVALVAWVLGGCLATTFCALSLMPVCIVIFIAALIEAPTFGQSAITGAVAALSLQLGYMSLLMSWRGG